MKRLVLFLLILSAILGTVAFAETRDEMKARFKKISRECAERTDGIFSKEEALRIVQMPTYPSPEFDCLRIGSLRDDLIRCATERHHLRRAAACPHQWHGIGPKVKGCAKCESIAHFVNGEWLVVLADGIWVGPEPKDYPEDYGLK